MALQRGKVGALGGGGTQVDNTIWHGTAAEWAADNRVLGAGVPGYESDTGVHRVGNGVSVWTALPQVGGSGFVGVPSATASPFYLAPAGAVAETFPRGGTALGTVSVLTSGTLRLVAIALAAGRVVTSITFTSIGAASAPTNQWFGLFSSARVALGLSADDTSTAWGANATKTLALTAPFTVTTSGLHYLGLMVAAGTPPTLAGITSTSVVTGQAPSLSGNTADTGLTAPPALPFTAGAITASGLMPYGVVL